MRVLLVIRSYFDAIFVKSLMDWEKNGYQLILELNAISGLHRLRDLRPDILILHHDVGWLDAGTYLQYIKQRHLPTQMLFLLGKRGAQAVRKKMFPMTTERIQMLNWESLSKTALEQALRDAAGAAKLEEDKSRCEKLALSTEEQIASAVQKLQELAPQIVSENVCLLRLVIEQKAQPFAVFEQLENLFTMLLRHPLRGKWFQEAKGDYCILIELMGGYSTYSRVEYLNDFSMTLLRSAKETLLGGAFITICYKTATDNLQEQYQHLCDLERYHYFCQDTALLSEGDFRRFRCEVSAAAVEKSLWAVYCSTVSAEPVKLSRNLQELYLQLLKPSMTFALVNRVRFLLCRFYEIIRDFYHLPVSQCPPLIDHSILHPEKTGSFFSVEQELEECMSQFLALIRQKEQLETQRNPVVLKTEQRLLLAFHSPLSMNIIADELGITPPYLSKIYKQETGLGLAQSLRDIRMAHAKVMMTDGERDIRRVSERTGFTDPKYFSRIFRQQFGLSPSAYLLQLQQEQRQEGTDR